MKRRLKLVPFEVQISADERDANLKEYLKANEANGILKWAVEGCLEWQKEGLNPPISSLDASNTYFQEEDTVGMWIEECCEIDGHCIELSSRLYDSIKMWLFNRGEIPPSNRRFSGILRERGFTSKHTKEGTLFAGLWLNQKESINCPKRLRIT